MLSPVIDLSRALQRPSSHLTLTSLTLWSAFANLGWPMFGTVSEFWVVTGVCGALGLAQLLGAFTMVSPCTRVTGQMWTAGTFFVTVLLALAGWQLLLSAAALGVASYAAGSAAVGMRGSEMEACEYRA